MRRVDRASGHDVLLETMHRHIFDWNDLILALLIEIDTSSGSSNLAFNNGYIVDITELL